MPYILLWDTKFSAPVTCVVSQMKISLSSKNIICIIIIFNFWIKTFKKNNVNCNNVKLFNLASVFIKTLLFNFLNNQKEKGDTLLLTEIAWKSINVSVSYNEQNQVRYRARVSLAYFYQALNFGAYHTRLNMRSGA